MKKFQHIFIILLILSLSGCSNFSSQKYVQTTEPQFNEIIKQESEYLELAKEQSVDYSARLNKVTQIRDNIKKAIANLDSLKPTPTTKTLNSDLKNYYEQTDSIFANLNDTIEFVDITKKFSNDLEKSTSSLPTDYNGDLTTTKNIFVQEKTSQEENLNNLKNKEVSAEFVKPKQALVDMHCAYVEFLGNVINAIDNRNANLVKADEMKTKIEKANADFNTSLEATQKNIFSQDRINQTSQLENKIKDEFNKM